MQKDVSRVLESLQAVGKSEFRQIIAPSVLLARRVGISYFEFLANIFRNVIDPRKER